MQICKLALVAKQTYKYVMRIKQVAHIKRKYIYIYIYIKIIIITITINK